MSQIQTTATVVTKVVQGRKRARSPEVTVTRVVDPSHGEAAGPSHRCGKRSTPAAAATSEAAGAAGDVQHYQCLLALQDASGAAAGGVLSAAGPVEPGLPALHEFVGQEWVPLFGL